MFSTRGFYYLDDAFYTFVNLLIIIVKIFLGIPHEALHYYEILWTLQSFFREDKNDIHA
jgi:hypothetical protein